MAITGVAVTVTLGVWDTANQAWKTGDAGNLTLRLVADGVVSTPSGTVAETDAANLPGQYELALTGAENTGTAMLLGGESSSEDCVVVPAVWHNADAAVSSRLASDDYTAPPSVSAIRTELETPGGMLATAAADVAGLDGDAIPDISGLATSTELSGLQTHGDETWGTLDVEDVDTQLSATHGSGSWLTRADNGIHTVTVTVETSGGTTFEGVRVAASGLDESNQYVEDTDTAGECTFYLNAGTWRFIAAATGAQSGGTVDVDVSAAQDVSLVVTAVALPDPAPAGYCSVYAIGEYQNGADAAGTFRVSALRSPQVRDEDGVPVAVFLGDDSPALVDGRATVTVLQGAVVSFVLSTSGGTISRENVTIPTETGPVDFLSLT